MLYFLTGNSSPQIRLLEQSALRQNSEFRTVDLYSGQDDILIWWEKVFINGRELTAADCCYSDLLPEFPFLPAAEQIGNSRYFSAEYATRQQQTSQAYTILSILSRQKLLFNSFEQLNRLSSQIDSLYRLGKTGLSIADYVVTDSLRFLEQNPLFCQPELYWSTIEHQSPLKKIPTAQLGELLTASNRQPYIFYRICEGIPVRIWLLKGEPVLAALITPPVCTDHALNLEKYEYLLDLDFFQADAAKIHAEFGLDFLEIYGTVNRESQQFTIYGIDPQPCFTELEETGKKWLAGRLISSLGNLPTKPPPPVNGPRSTLYLTKMLEPLL